MYGDYDRVDKLASVGESLKRLGVLPSLSSARVGLDDLIHYHWELCRPARWGVVRVRWGVVGWGVVGVLAEPERYLWIALCAGRNLLRRTGGAGEAAGMTDDTKICWLAREGQMRDYFRRFRRSVEFIRSPDGQEYNKAVLTSTLTGETLVERDVYLMQEQITDAVVYFNFLALTGEERLT